MIMENKVKTCVEVQASDIKSIGVTATTSSKGTTVISCELMTAFIEEILLRSILKCFGDQYRIVDQGDFEGDNGEQYIEYETNLPWELYKNSDR
jgi:hypothetical protein